MESIEDLRKLASEQKIERIARAKRNIAKHGITIEKMRQLAAEAEKKEMKPDTEKYDMKAKIQELEQQLAARDQKIAELERTLAAIRELLAWDL